MVAFAALALLARATHPGRAGAATSTTPVTTAQTEDDQSDFFFGDPSISSSAPDSSNDPQTQSSGS